MAASVRNVVARYSDEPHNMGPFEQEEDWVTHLKNKADAQVQPSKVVLKMLDNNFSKDKATNPDSTTVVNPYDYDSPSTMTKERDDHHPFWNKAPEEIDKGYYNRPEVFEEDSPLDYWRRVREEDYTVDEDQQSPAMSQTRSPGAGRAAFILKKAATLSQVLDSDTHYNNSEKVRRSYEVSAKLMGNAASRENGLYSFRTSSPSGSVRKVYFQFLRPQKGTANPKSLLDYPVQLSCNCQSFLFHGAQYYAIHDRYLYGPGIPGGRRNRNIAPTPQTQISTTRYTSKNPNSDTTSRNNPGRGVNFRVCKHILAAYNALSTQPKLVVVKAPYKSFPEFGPPLPLFDKKVWKELMGFEFTKANVRKMLKRKKPTTPAFFQGRSISRKFIEWMRSVWLPRTDAEKIKVLQTLIEHPEEIFLILLKDAYYTDGMTSDYLIDTGFNLMDRVVQERTPVEEVQDPSDSKLKELKEEEIQSAKRGKYPTDGDLKETEDQEEKLLEPVETESQYNKGKKETQEDEDSEEDSKGIEQVRDRIDRVTGVKGVKSPYNTK